MSLRMEPNIFPARIRGRIWEFGSLFNSSYENENKNENENENKNENKKEKKID